MALNVEVIPSGPIGLASNLKSRKNSEAAAVKARVDNVFDNSAPIPTFSAAMEMKRIQQDGNPVNKDVALS